MVSYELAKSNQAKKKSKKYLENSKSFEDATKF